MYTVITQQDCKWCTKAKDLLFERGLPFEVYPLEDHRFLVDVFPKLKLKTVPQIWDRHIYVGGYEDLAKYLDH